MGLSLLVIMDKQKCEMKVIEIYIVVYYLVIVLVSMYGFKIERETKMKIFYNKWNKDSDMYNMKCYQQLSQM